MAMLRAMDSAVAGLRAHQSKLDVIGHNIANVNTFGYKSQNYSFQEAMYQTSSSSTAGSARAGGTNAAQYGYGSLTGSITMDMTASTPTYLGGFNATISGQGFFVTNATKETQAAASLKSNGRIQYSRVGQFLIDSKGFMVDSGGNFIYGFRCTQQADAGNDATFAGDTNPNAANLTPLCVPEGVLLENIKINDLGEVTGTIKSIGNPDVGDNTYGPAAPANGLKEGEVISLGKVALATFQNPEGLTKQGGYYYGADPSDNAGAVAVSQPGDNAASLMAGYLEASNVDLAKEFSEMITAQRGFQANTKMITVSDEVLNELVNMKR